MKVYILLTSVAILVTGCTSTSNLKHHAGSDGSTFKNNPEVTLKDFKLNKKESSRNKNKDESTADTTPVSEDTPVTDTAPEDTEENTPPDNDEYDPFTGGLYGPYT